MSFFRRTVLATFGLTAANGLVRLLALASMMAFTRWLSPQAYGNATLLMTFISLASVVALAGADMSYARGFHARRAPNGTAVEIFVWRYVLGASGAAAVLGAAAWLWLLAPKFALPTYLAGFAGFGIALTLISVIAQTRTRLHEQYRRLALTLAAGGTAAIGIGVGFAYVGFTSELPLVVTHVGGLALLVLALGTPGWAALRKPSGLLSEERRAVLGVGLAGIVTAPAQWVLSSVDRWFLVNWHGASAAGVYSVAFSVSIIANTLSHSLNAVWLPEVLRENQKTGGADALTHLASDGERFVIILAIAWLAVASAGGDLIRWLLDPRFHGAAEVVPILAGAVFFNGVQQLAVAGLLLRNQLPRAAWAWLAGVIVCLSLNAALVPTRGQSGAALAQLAAFAVVALIVLFSSHRHLVLVRRIGRTGVALLVIAILGVLLQMPMQDDPRLSLIVKLPIGILIALGAFGFTAPQVLRDALQTLGRRLHLNALRAATQPREKWPPAMDSLTLDLTKGVAGPGLNDRTETPTRGQG